MMNPGKSFLFGAVALGLAHTAGGCQNTPEVSPQSDPGAASIFQNIVRELRNNYGNTGECSVDRPPYTYKLAFYDDGLLITRQTTKASAAQITHIIKWHDTKEADGFPDEAILLELRKNTHYEVIKQTEFDKKELKAGKTNESRAAVSDYLNALEIMGEGC